MQVKCTDNSKVYTNNFIDWLFLPGLLPSSGFFASIKSRFFHTEPLAERIGQIEQEHGLKREDWKRIKDEYDSRFRALKARMDYLDYRSAKLKEEIGDLDDAELKALQSNRDLTENEILDKLNQL